MGELIENVLQFGCCQVFSDYRLRHIFPINCSDLTSVIPALSQQQYVENLQYI